MTTTAASGSPIIIVAGYASAEALAFLAENGARIEQYRNLYLVQLPANAIVGREGGAARRHSIIFVDEAGEQVDNLAVIVTLKINGLSSRLDLVFDPEEEERPIPPGEKEKEQPYS